MITEQVDLQFTANITQAKTQIQLLQEALDKIASSTARPTSLFDDREISKASKAALELKQHISEATNVNTGKLDLSRFSISLAKSGKTLKDYQTSLSGIGSEGQAAFLQIARAVSEAEAPVTRINAKLVDMGKTLKNTVKWQISSSLLHRFMGTLQSAYGYAQDLDRSLNDIRIVTGYSTDQMAKFASEANKAAKALSSTTTDYTDAALIYYQQGLSDQEIKERTDVTIKMANATGESAKIVSDQMTAVWNNFDDGSKSLEYYADVMTKLGAATASSTDEIATGLSKFAAISNTVGLSYEYATAALTTITAKTRESADTVGTALKAIFARIQGLELGKTLEDGTNLNKYSQALAKVGVNIKDSNGELKNMDTILKEMAGVWETLSRDEKVALAEKVAGVRQYNQLMSLMENWDFMEENLGYVADSEGALEEQADIYAESWQAAQKRVKAAAQDVYDSLIDEQFFIKMLNGIEKVLDGVSGLVDGFGGLKGVILLVSSIFTKQFASKIPDVLSNLKANFMVVTGQSTKLAKQIQDDSIKELEKIQDSGYSEQYKTQATGMAQLIKMQQTLMLNSKNMTNAEIEEYKARMENVKSIYNEVTALAKKSDEAAASNKKMRKNYAKEKTKNYDNEDELKQLEEKRAALQQEQAKMEEQNQKKWKTGTPENLNNNEDYVALGTQLDEVNKKIDEINTKKSSLLELAGITDDINFDELDSVQLAQVQKAIEKLIADYQKLVATDRQYEAIEEDVAEQTGKWEKTAKEIGNNEAELKELKASMIEYIDKIKNDLSDVGLSNSDVFNQLNDLQDELKTTEGSAKKAAEKMAELFKPGALGSGLSEDINAAEQKLKDLGYNSKQIKNISDGATSEAEAFIELKNSQAQARREADKSIEVNYHLSSALTDVGSSIMAVSSAVSSWKNAMEVFSDESSTAADKIGAFSAALLSTVNGITSSNDTFSKIGSKVKSILAGNTKGMIGLTAAQKLATVASNTFNISLSEGAALLGVYALAAIAIVAVLATVAIAIYKVVEALKLEAARKEEATRNAKALSENYENLTKKATEFKEAVSNYEEAIKSLESLKKGTDEYASALEETNAQAEALLEKYNLWDKFAGFDSEGKIIFEEGALDDAQQQKEQQVNNAKFMESAFDIRKAINDNAEGKEYYKPIAASYQGNTTSGLLTENKNLAVDTIKKATLPSTEEVGAKITEVFQDALKSGINLDSDEKITEYFKSLSQTSGVEPWQIEFAKENKEALLNNAKLNNQFEAQQKLYYGEQITAMAKEKFGSNADEVAKRINVQNPEEFSDKFINVLGQAIAANKTSAANEENWAEKVEQARVKSQSINGLEDLKSKYSDEYGGIESTEDLAREYARAVLGYTDDEVKKMNWDKESSSLTSGEDDNQTKIVDSSTTSSDDQIRALGFASEIGKEKENWLNSPYGKGIENYLEDLVDGASELGNEYGGNFVDALLDAVSTKKLDLSNVLGDLTESEKNELLALDADSLVKKLGIDADTLEALGLGSAEAFEKAFDTELKKWSPENFKEKLAAETAEDAEKYDLDADAVQEVAESFAELAKKGEKAYEGLDENAELASDAATRFVRLQDAVKDLCDNYDDYADVLKEVQAGANKADKAYASNSANGKKLKKTLSDLLGTTEDLIDADLIDAIDPDDFKKAAHGDEEAIGNIRDAFIELQAKANDVDVSGLKNELDQLKDGATLNLDTSPFLTELINAQLEAGVSAENLESLLSGLGIDADVTDFYGTLADAQAYAAQVGGMVVDDLSFSQEATTEANEVEKNGTQVGFEEEIIPQMITKTNDVTETDASGKITSTSVDSHVWRFTKTVKEDKVPTQSTDTVTNTEVKTTNGAGKSGNEKPSNHKILTGKKSVGNRVAPSTQAATTPKSSGGSGGKSGKSSNPAEKIKKTKKDDVVDRYKTSDSLLKRISNSLSKVDAKMESAYGARRVKLLQNSNKLLQTQLTLLGKQRKEAEEYYKLDKYNVKKAGKELGLNFKFDGSVITNYASQMEKVYKKLNVMEDHMNSLSTKEAQDEYKEKYYDPYKEKVDDLKEYIDTLEDTKDKLQEIDEAALEAANQFRSQHLEALTYTVEIRFDVQDRYLKYAEYMLKKIESRGYSAALAVENLSSQINNVLGQTKTTRDAITDVLKNELFDNEGKSIGFTNKEVKKFLNGELTPEMAAKLEQNEEAWNKILEYQEKLLEDNEKILDLRTEINDKVAQAFDEWTEDMDTLIDEFSHYTSVMDSYIDIVDLLGKNRLGMSNADMAKMHKSQAENYRNEAESLQLYNKKLEESLVGMREGQAEAEARVAEYEKKYAKIKKTGTDEQIKTIQEQYRASLEDLDMWTENVQKAEQKIRDNDEAARQAVYNSLEEEKEAFLANMEESVDQIEKHMAGSYGTIAEMQKDFDQHSEIDERYVDDYERIYKLTKMSRELSKKMDESNNLRVKKQLAKLQQEIVEYQEEGRKLSQYDLEYLQKKYDLRVAELALEEAQQAKTQVRLTRDTEGNYSYTYTADEDSMADAQQAYEDKLYEITDFSNNYIKEQTSQLLSTQQSYIDSLREIHQNAADGMYKTTEEYQKALDDCTEYYTMKMQYHSGEIDKASINNTLIYATDYAVYEEYTGKKLTAAEKYRNEMDRAILEEKAKVEKLQIEKQDALNEINRLYHEGYYESEEAFQAALAQTEQAYDERISKAKIKVDGLIAERIAKYGEDSKEYDLNAKKKDASEDGFINNIFNQYLPKLKESNETASSYVNGFVEKIGSAKDGTGYLGSAKKSYGDLSTGIDKSLKTIGTSQETFKTDTKAAFDEISKSSTKTKGDVEKLAEKVKTLKNTITSVRDFQKKYCDEMAKIIAKNEAVVKSITQVENKLAKRAEKVQGGGKVDNGGKTDGSKTGNDDDSKGGGKKTQGNGKVEVGDVVTLNKGEQYYYDSWGTAPSGNYNNGVKNGVRVDSYTLSGPSGAQKYWIHLTGNKAPYNGWDFGWVKQSQISGYKTGGYTGAWGDQGKMAILHEKELVLNKDDTENMLKMVAMVRDITKTLDYTGLAQLSAVSLGAITTSNESLNQNVVIQAEFPNAIYASEIEAALNNLVNSASQYANRK